MKKLIQQIAAIPTDKYIHFAAGLCIAAFFALAIPQGAPYCVLPAVAAGIAKDIYDEIDYGGWDWADLAFTAAGGFIIQVFVWVGMCFGV